MMWKAAFLSAGAFLALMAGPEPQTICVALSLALLATAAVRRQSAKPVSVRFRKDPETARAMAPTLWNKD
jgi:hypothetical protein